MIKADDIEYGIKYRVIKILKGKFILFPVSIEEGETIGFDFQAGTEKISLLSSSDDLKKRYVMENVYFLEELKEIYEFAEDELNEDNKDFLSEYFYNDYKEKIIYVETDSLGDIAEKLEIDLDFMKEKEEDITFMYNKDIPSVILNEDALNAILQCNNIKEIKVLMEKYKRLVLKFEELREQQITKIKIKNKKIEEIETIREVESFFSNEKDNKVIISDQETSTISYEGLRKAIKERVFGHDEQIDIFAQKLYMNYTAREDEGTESILLIGPTGTGKTETINAACSYLDIPSISVNASNIVPQGIKGTSIEDIIISIYERAGRDIYKAQRGLIFLDEFDKLNESELDIKTVIKNILLTFTAGGIFPINDEYYDFTYNSLMTNKVFAGVFDKITSQNRNVGFITSQEPKVHGYDVRKKIVEKNYFTLEELSRISTILTFDELDRETKKRILLESKLSELNKKRARYKRQFGIDLIIDDSFVEAILDSVPTSETGMRSVNNMLKKIIDEAERGILENECSEYKKLVLTKKTVQNSNNFDLS